MSSLTFEPPPASRSGIVVARFRRDFLVEGGDGARHRCLSARRAVRPVVGDRVAFEASTGAQAGRISAIEPRHNCLERIDNRGRREPMAANLTQLAVVIAVLPEPDRLVLDRYLCAAALLDLPALIVCNKIDLDGEEHAGPLHALLDDYRRMDYPVLTVSARTDRGMDALRQRLRGRCSSLVGQSGVGKSSLINRLIPQAGQAVGALSEKGGAGRHTTTTAVMHTLPDGGHVIDSPGVRSYSPPLPAPARVQRGFREIVACADRCRFADCLHREEPGCAVRGALDAGEISAHRYASYGRLLAQAQRYENPWSRPGHDTPR